MAESYLLKGPFWFLFKIETVAVIQAIGDGRWIQGEIQKRVQWVGLDNEYFLNVETIGMKCKTKKEARTNLKFWPVQLKGLTYYLLRWERLQKKQIWRKVYEFDFGHAKFAMPITSG